MNGLVLATIGTVALLLIFAAWRRYCRIVREPAPGGADTCPFSVTEKFGDTHLLNAPHQKGVRWLSEVFSRTARRFPEHVALQVPHTGDVLTYAELDREAERIAAAVRGYVTGPDQIVAVSMAQESWHPVACHLGILRAGGTCVFLDSTMPDALIEHMLSDAQPVLILSLGGADLGEVPMLDVRELADEVTPVTPPDWMDDPADRLATIFYTSGTTGMPKGVECPHAGYVNLALTYADYFDLVPGMDATTLTSSLSYDGSISEMYSAWVCGCAVVMLTKDEVRAGPDLLPVLRDAEVTVLFCPPVLLTTLTQQPEYDLPYPLCRYIVPAGEAFPQALVEPWTRARRQIINTYGPTEASTDASRQSLRPGEPVTIGSPLANVTYVILEPGSERALELGETGELCIGGVHVSRGYRNLPEQTAEKFISHPKFGRLYRTGDRCRIDPETCQTEFLGRIDTQLKVRGHRVEVQAVEDILQTQIAEIDTAVLDYQQEELVAFIAAPALTASERPDKLALAPSEWAEGVTEVLASQLPASSVPTRLFLVQNFELNRRSGKIDRDRLPRLSDHSGAIDQTPKSMLEDVTSAPIGTSEAIEKDDRHGRTSETALNICRELFGSSLGLDDCFIDHGGHSILIAQLAQKLRMAGWAIPVRALLSECNTARKVSEWSRNSTVPVLADRQSQARTSERDEGAASTLSVPVFTARQALFLLILYGPHLLGFVAVVAFGDIGQLFLTAGLLEFIGIGALLYSFGLSLPFANLFWSVTIKRILVGRGSTAYPASGAYPKWSLMHLRCWSLERIQGAALGPLDAMFRSPPLTAFALRCLGARVGRDTEVAHEVSFSGPLDLLRIDDRVAIQSGAYVQLSRWIGGELHLGPIHLEEACKIGMRACVSHGVVVGRGAWLASFAAAGGDVAPGELLEGAPGRPVGQCIRLARAEPHCGGSTPLWLREVSNIMMQVVLDFALLVLPATLVTWSAKGLLPDEGPASEEAYFLTEPLVDVVGVIGFYTVVTAWVTIVLTSVLACLFIRWTRTTPGLYASRGSAGALLLYRQRLMNQVQRVWTWTIMGQYLRALAGLRLSRTGGSECDVMHNLVPEVATADARVFWANGCLTNMLDQDSGQIVLRQLDMPVNFFASNNCVAEEGQLPTNFLLGVSSPGNGIAFRRQMHARRGPSLTIAGNPPVRFASADFEAERERHAAPSMQLFFGRMLLNDIVGVGVVRAVPIVVYVILYTIMLRLGGDALFSAFAALILSEVVLISGAVVTKHLLVGRSWGSDHSAPFWSWRHFTYFFAQDCFFAWCRGPFSLTAGTVLPNTILRWMGCEIGERTIIVSPLQAFDWNAVSIDRDAVVDGLLQYHSLENMTLTVKRTRIGDGAVVNAGATVMGGAEIEANATLLPLVLVLKEMNLPTGIYHGSPADLAHPSDQIHHAREAAHA